MKVKEQIQEVINEFNQKDLFDAGINLFKTLGYNTERQNRLDNPTYEGFYNNYIEVSDKIADIEKFKEKAHVQEWKRIELLFQLTDSEMSNRGESFGTGKVNNTLIEAYLFFAIELKGNNYTRTVLSSITRQINKVFPMPVMVLFKYNDLITLSVIKRRINEKDESKDVLKKVTLIKDISLENPHRAHIEILFDLSFNELLRVHKFTNFVELHNAWQKTLDTKELNKRFYQELSNWYFWAMDNVSFPDDVENNRDVRNSINLIRLITRIIFIWFIKEKNLVPNTLFSKSVIKKILKEFLKDKNSNSYYRAVLQNLFFGTLNQKMGERSFAKNGSFHDNINEYGVKNLFRYDNLFAIDKKEVLNLFKNVPFLNGGLFDCLDKPDDFGTIIYIDGFSRNPKKQANIPDFLFFSDEQEINLNKIYGTKNKKYKAKGLINILSSYKFTVTENTPIEEEIALDPELLGKVFENLLASYNPETQTTARKQTGSFYTPREIVNYMADESLKSYLKQKLTDKTDLKSEDTDVALEFLFEYNEQEHLFNEKQTKVLIEAIDTCKILDPACGSGAFPMGILHKFVHILHKLDPKNEQWKERQIQKARQIDDITIQEHSIADIESAFTNNELDYGRKLYLIENCIYGVDIQPIAVQIAKLRFFISLVVDQKKQVNEENLGIRALPNFETKFVAANTLIGLEKEKEDWLNNQEIIQLKNELKDIRHQYFSAKTRKEKLFFQKKDKDLRRKIRSILIEIQKRELTAKINNSKEMLEIKYYDDMIKRFNDNQKKRKGFETKRQKLFGKLEKIKKSFTSSSEKTAKQLSSWDPYDQNASSPFFDVEWMFGVKDGFDVVIANPPWIQSKVLANSFKLYLSKKFETAVGQFDLFNCFIEKGIELLKKNGILTLITPDRFINNSSYSLLRKFLLTKAKLKRVIALGDGIFENVAMPSAIFFSYNELPSQKDLCYFRNKFFSGEENIVFQKEILNESEFIFPVFTNKITNKIISKIKTDTEFFGIFLNNARGVEIGKKSDIVYLKRESKDLMPFLRGEDIDRYMIKGNVFIDLSDTDVNYKEADLYKSSKVLIRKTGTGINAVVDDKFRYFIQVIYSLKSKYPTKLSEHFFCALLNSKLMRFFYYKIFGQEERSTFPHLTQDKILQLPLKKLRPKDLINRISTCSEYVHLLYFKNNYLIASFFDSLIDVMVYKLYFPNEIKAADAEVLKYLSNLPELKNDWIDEKKLEVIEEVYKEISDPKHPVSIAMEKMKEIPEVRIIEGLDKKK